MSLNWRIYLDFYGNKIRDSHSKECNNNNMLYIAINNINKPNNLVSANLSTKAHL